MKSSDPLGLYPTHWIPTTTLGNWDCVIFCLHFMMKMRLSSVCGGSHRSRNWHYTGPGELPSPPHRFLLTVDVSPEQAGPCWGPRREASFSWRPLSDWAVGEAIWEGLFGLQLRV